MTPSEVCRFRRRARQRGFFGVLVGQKFNLALIVGWFGALAAGSNVLQNVITHGRADRTAAENAAFLSSASCLSTPDTQQLGGVSATANVATPAGVFVGGMLPSVQFQGLTTQEAFPAQTSPMLSTMAVASSVVTKPETVGGTEVQTATNMSSTRQLHCQDRPQTSPFAETASKANRAFMTQLAGY